MGTRKTAEYLAKQGVLAPRILTQTEASDLRNLRTNPRDRVHQNDDLQFILELERMARGGPLLSSGPLSGLSGGARKNGVGLVGRPRMLY